MQWRESIPMKGPTVLVGGKRFKFFTFFTVRHLLCESNKGLIQFAAERVSGRGSIRDFLLVDRPIKTIINNPFGLSLSKANIGRQ